LRATRLFVRKAMADRYFDRVPSLPATDDRSAKPLAEDLSTGSGDGGEITGEADTAGPDEVPAAAGPDAGPAQAGAEPGGNGAAAEPGENGAGATARVNGNGDAAGEGGNGDAAGEGAVAKAGESGRWFRPAAAEKRYTTIRPDEQGDRAGAEADAEAEPGVVPEAEANAEAEAGALPEAEPGAVPEAEPGPAPPPADVSVHPADVSVPPLPADVSTPLYRGPGWAASAAGRIGSAAGRVLAPSPEGPVLAPPPGGVGLASPDKGTDERPGEQVPGRKRRVSRRTMLQAGLIGGAGVAALPLLTLASGITRTDENPTDLAFSLNANWLFGGQYMTGSEGSIYDDSGFASVTVPHTVIPLSWKDWDFAAWQQVWVYRRHFSGARLLDQRRPGDRILVDFDGVMVNAAVSINDHVVATHQGGYLPFSAELTGKVTSGDNLLSVVVDSRCLPVPPIGVGRGPNSVDFFQPGGIYRDVRLRVLPQVFLADLFARPADVLGAQPRVDIECTVDSAATAHAEGTLLVQLLDGREQLAARAMTVQAGSPGTSTARLSLTGFGPVSLWSPDSPRLYTVQATLNFPGIGSHTLSRRIGFREASFRPDGFFLNGKRLQLFGLNRHQLYPYAGMAMGARVQRKDAEILKNEFNCNMVRCSHYPQSPAFLDACDELGLLVWEEAPGWHNVSGAAAWHDAVLRDVRDMVIRDRSRPSVIIWGTRLNETENFPGLWAATRQAARELDGTRPSSGAMAFHEDITWSEDVFAYNDYGTEDKTGNIALKPPLPGLPYLISEAVGVQAVKPEHFAWTDPPAWLVHQAAMHGQAQSQARSNPGYAGLLAWAGFDYGSLLGPGPYDIKWAGLADGFRVPKPGAAIYRTQGDPAVRPVIIPVFFWEAGGAVPSPGPAPGQTAMIASN
jgi:beta-galactosidase